MPSRISPRYPPFRTKRCTRLLAGAKHAEFPSGARPPPAPGDRLVASFRPADAMVYAAEADQTADAEAVGELTPSTDLDRAETVQV